MLKLSKQADLTCWHSQLCEDVEYAKIAGFATVPFAMQNALARVCGSESDISDKLDEITVRRACEIHGINDSGSFDNALDERVTQE